MPKTPEIIEERLERWRRGGLLIDGPSWTRPIACPVGDGAIPTARDAAQDRQCSHIRSYLFGDPNSGVREPLPGEVAFDTQDGWSAFSRTVRRARNRYDQIGNLIEVASVV